MFYERRKKIKTQSNDGTFSNVLFFQRTETWLGSSSVAECWPSMDKVWGQCQAHTCSHSPGVGRQGYWKFKTIPSYLRNSRLGWVT